MSSPHRFALVAILVALASCADSPRHGPTPAPSTTDAPHQGAPWRTVGTAATSLDAIAPPGDPGEPGEPGEPGDPSEPGVTRPTFDECFAGLRSTTGAGPDYTPYSPTMGTHCAGTDHQAIEGIERVVFLGDSVTVGTPPNSSNETYRGLLADRLAERFDLEAPGALWRSWNALSGTALVTHSGDFWSCAEWGARTDDLLEDNSQILDCFPELERTKKTLVVMTMGGNDIAAFTKDGADGMPVDQVSANVAAIVQKLRDAIAFLKDPAVFPGGVDVVFTNNFEFTDATGDVASCPAAGAAGFDRPWQDPRALADLVVWMMEQYLAIAVETDSDLVFVLESFCGHGFHHDDPTNGCYRGADAERWFDLTCIHPNPTGHAQLADMFLAVVDE